MFVVVAVAKFFYILLFNSDSLGAMDNSSLSNYLKAIFNYPIYLFNSWGASSSSWLTYENWLLNQGVSFDYKVCICYVLSFIVLIGIVLGIFNLIKKCLSFGRL